MGKKMIINRLHKRKRIGVYTAPTHVTRSVPSSPV